MVHVRVSDDDVSDQVALFSGQSDRNTTGVDGDAVVD